jgi:hypothetical protein
MMKTIDQADIATAMLEEFERELVTTRKFLERVPADQLNWRPHEKSMTAGQLALHIASVPSGVLTLSLRDVAPPPDMRSAEATADLAGSVRDARGQRDVRPADAAHDR